MRFSSTRHLFLPIDFSTLLLWLDGNDPNNNNTIPANGSAIATWKDKSKNGNNFTQSTGAQQPINLNNAIGNGRNMVNFGASVFNQMDSTPINLTANFSLMMVLYPLSTSQGYAFNITTASTPELWVITQSNQIQIGLGGSANLFGVVPINALSIITYTYDSTGFANLYVNGVFQINSSTLSVSAAGSIGRRVGCSRGNPALLYKGYVGDVILASGTWSATDRRRAELWSATKWSTQV